MGAVAFPGAQPAAEALPYDPLAALIEEARRRARRRRRRYLAVSVVGIAAGASILFGATHRGGPQHAGAETRGKPPQVAVGPTAVANGPLTLADVETIKPGEGPPGWYAVSTLGSDGRLHAIVRCPERVDWCGEVEGVAWSPDGAWLALGVSSVGSPNPYNGLHLINPATGDDRTIRTCQPAAGECDWFDLAWSPNGSELAYVSSHDIALVKSDGTRRRLLVSDPFARASSPSWSPDGQWLAFSERSNNDSAVYLIRSDGTDRRLLVQNASAPAWSPSGATIAYRTRCGIKLVTTEGLDATPPTPWRCSAIGISGRPVWSPDGTKIAVVGTTRYGTGAPARGTYVMNADGTGLARVTPKTQGVYMGSDPRPAWRPVPIQR